MDHELEKRIRDLNDETSLADEVHRGVHDPVAAAATMMLLTRLMRETGTKEIEIRLGNEEDFTKDAVALYIDRENRAFIKATYVTEEEANAVRSTQ